MIVAAGELAPAEGAAPTDSCSAWCISGWKRASSSARSDASLACVICDGVVKVMQSFSLILQETVAGSRDYKQPLRRLKHNG